MMKIITSYIYRKGMKQIMHKKLVFLFIGRTASGKSSLARYICETLGLRQVKSITTRLPRKDEITGYEDHYFVSESEFDEIKFKEGFVAYTEINGIKYGTTYNEIVNSDIYVIDPNGAKYLKEHCKDEFKFIEIYFSSPFELAKDRFLKRDGSEEEFYSRYNSEDEQFTKYEEAERYDHLFVNDMSFSKASEALRDLLKSEMEKEKSL